MMVERTLQGCGIYRILNIANGKFYIGSSVDIADRCYVHFWGLRNGKHHSYRLQADYNEFGESVFTAQVVELVTCPEDLLKVEQWYLDDTLCYTESVGYNISPTAGNTLGKPCLPETRKRIGDANRGLKRSAEVIARLVNTFSLPEHQERMARWHRTVETRQKVSKTKGGTGVVLTFEDVQKAIALYETGSVTIKKLAATFGVSYQQMRSALVGEGPKYGIERQTYAVAIKGREPAVVAAKVSSTLCSVSDEVIQRVRDLHATGQYTQVAIARELGLGTERVSRILNAKLVCYGKGKTEPKRLGYT